MEQDTLDFILDLPEYIFNIRIYDNNKPFDNLSFGEKQPLGQLNIILL